MNDTVDFLYVHLLDILSDPASAGLILTGGYGLHLKQIYLQESNAATLVASLPEARATQDLDFILSLALFVQPVKTTVYVPHPYAWINMKIAAAYDWLRRERGEMPPKYGSGKHVFDVYILTAMLTEVEISEAVDIARRYQAHPIAQSMRGWVYELYGSDEAPGVQEIMRQAGSDIDYPLFWQGLQACLGIS